MSTSHQTSFAKKSPEVRVSCVLYDSFYKFAKTRGDHRISRCRRIRQSHETISSIYHYSLNGWSLKILTQVYCIGERAIKGDQVLMLLAFAKQSSHPNTHISQQNSFFYLQYRRTKNTLHRVSFSSPESLFFKKKIVQTILK